MNGSKLTATSDMAQIAEDMATFFEDEKIKTQNRIRQCEMFANDVRLQSSHSVKDGKSSSTRFVILFVTYYVAVL